MAPTRYHLVSAARYRVLAEEITDQREQEKTVVTPITREEILTLGLAQFGHENKLTTSLSDRL